MPRVQEAPVIPFFDESEKYISAERVLEGEILLPAQPYDYDMMSPTPLDPFNLRTTGIHYYNAAEMIMDARLHEMAMRHSIPEDIQKDVMSEIKFEHEHRSHKNADAMSRLREAVKDRNIDSFDTVEANDIMRARAGVSCLGRIAVLLTEYPEIDAVEVMKFTKPFDRVALALAEAAFIARMHHTAHAMGPTFEVELTQGEQPRPIDTHDQVSPAVMPYKVKEADLLVNGEFLEVISRPSYIALDPAIELPGVPPQLKQTGDVLANVQPIGVTKYIRIAKK